MMGIDSKQLLRHWIHSHEEDSGEELVFRPDDYDFPPARGRRGFVLTSEGTMFHERPSPDDRSMQVQGRWCLEHENCLVLEEPSGQVVYRIKSIDTDRLVLERLP